MEPQPDLEQYDLEPENSSNGVINLITAPNTKQLKQMKKPSGFEPPSMYDKLPEMPIENPLENFPKAPEKDLSPIE